MASKSGWSAVPDDIVCLIADKINYIEDYVRFCAVSRSWYLIAVDHYNLTKKFQFAPVLMLTEALNSRSKRKREATPNKRRFQSYMSGKSFDVHLPEAAGRRCWGSQFGWIITFGAADLEFSLLNPFSRAIISLPSLRTLLPHFSGRYDPNRRFIRAVLTASPDSPDCLVFLIARPAGVKSILGFAKPGSNCRAWSRFQGPGDLNDVVCYQGKFYGCRRDSLEVVLIHVNLQPPRAAPFSVLPLVPGDRKSLGCYKVRTRVAFEVSADFNEFMSTLKYLVDVGGELCLVLRYCAGNMTYYFKVFKLNTETRKWTRVFPFGENRCLFLGNNSTFLYEATPIIAATSNFEANVIYYTHDDDLSPYSLDQGKFALDGGLEGTRKKSIVNPSLWITPYLRFSPLKKIHDSD